ncbi:glycosyl hydrolase YngK-like isoform X2 [Babylonia areolata]
MDGVEREFRAVWVATVANIDWPSSGQDPSSKQRQDLVDLLDTLKDLHFNAVIFQVRPAADAFYSSPYDPWSIYLTGRQGQAPHPFWDPLATAVTEAHARGMELHAWFNPYRAKAGSTSLTDLAPQHMARQLPQDAHPYGPNLWMDPGSRAVQNRTLDTILHVVTHYDIDGVHFDDYFYPYPEQDQDFPDDATYQAYVAEGGRLSRALWRHHNVDGLVQEVSRRIKDVRPWVKFGISPFGIWMSGQPSGVVGFSSNTGQYADSRKWLAEGWVDYLAPQLYWEIDPPRQSFTALSDWWIQQNSRGRHLYMGCATYRTATGDRHWPVSEIERQVRETRSRRNESDLGNIFFSAKYYRDNTGGIADLFRDSVYPRPALAPTMPWLRSDVPTLSTPDVTVQSGVVSWTTSADPAGKLRAFAVYRQEGGGAWHPLHVLGTHTRSIQLSPGRYGVTAVDRLGRESAPHLVLVESPLVG